MLYCYFLASVLVRVLFWNSVVNTLTIFSPDALWPHCALATQC